MRLSFQISTNLPIKTDKFQGLKGLWQALETSLFWILISYLHSFALLRTSVKEISLFCRSIKVIKSYGVSVVLSLLTYICSCFPCLISTMCTSLHNNNNNNYSFSHRILMLTSLVNGIPTPLSAVHLKLSPFFPRLMVKGIVTAVLSETLVQVIVGFGFPSAEQFKVNSAGAVTFWSLEVIMLLGGATKKKSIIHF